MRQKTDIELQRLRISLRLRAEASILRAEFLNAFLPAALTEFDRRLQNGEPIEVQSIDINRLVEQAVSDATGG